MKRKTYSADFKAKVAVDALSGLKRIAEIAAEYSVHPNRITEWKKQAIEGLPEVFSRKGKKAYQEEAVLRDRLYQQIGQLQVEVEWLRKKVGQVK